MTYEHKVIQTTQNGKKTYLMYNEIYNSYEFTPQLGLAGFVQKQWPYFSGDNTNWKNYIDEGSSIRYDIEDMIKDGAVIEVKTLLITYKIEE